MNPKYPIYIPSKGRADSRLTVKALDRIGVPYTVVVEPQQFDEYAAVIDPRKLLVTPHRDKGLTFTRNWIWDHARDSGTERFWTMDDNIKAFFRFNRNLKVPVADGARLAAIEEFTERYTNVPISGMNYFMFASRKSGNIPPFTPNTRVYSNMLIETNARDKQGKPFRNECYFNDDTDLCLRVLKDGQCTILFNAFLIEKSVTMVVKGGNTPEYQDDGRWWMAEELRQKHPDVTTITRKWGRWQHQVDYRPFKGNTLVRREGVTVEPGVNNFGMKLVQVGKGGSTLTPALETAVP